MQLADMQKEELIALATRQEAELAAEREAKSDATQNLADQLSAMARERDALRARIDAQPVAGELPPLPVQAVCDVICENSMLTEYAMGMLLNGDAVALNSTTITAIVNKVNAAQPVQQPAAVRMESCFAQARQSGHDTYQVLTTDGLSQSLPIPPAAGVQGDAFPERDQSKPAEQQGVFRKFDVRRVDGSDAPGGKHHGCRYFVLDMGHDQHAAPALSAYAASCAATHPALSAELAAEFGQPDSGRDAALLNEVADVLANQNWRGDLQEQLRALAAHPANGAQAGLSDAQIVSALHSLGVDTYPSKFGFSTLQVSATSVPTIRQLVELLAAPQKKEG